MNKKQITLLIGLLMLSIVLATKAFSQQSDAQLTTSNDTNIRNKTLSSGRVADMIQLVIDNKVNDDKIEQTITNGNTATVPSSDALFDALSLKANSASPTFTGTVTLPSTTSIGTVSSTEVLNLDGTTSAIQTQIDSKEDILTFTASDFNESGQTVSIDYTNGQAASGSSKGLLTSADWTTFNNKAPTASPSFTGTPTVPTASASVSNTQVASTAFVHSLIVPTSSTGTAIAFDVPRTYGYSADETGNITLNATGLREGVTQLIIHNNGSGPTFGSEFKIIGGTYQTGVDNYIFCHAVKSNLILVTISQEQ